MRLIELIKSIKESSEQNCSQIINSEITNISCDSRNLNRGDIFVAIEGLKVDGHDFIADAVRKGASAIVCQKKIEINENIPIIRVDNTRKYLAQIACKINKNPSTKLTMTGITGTNGKTTTSYIIEQIIKKTGQNPGVIGTINHRFNSFEKKHSVTTPGSLKLQKIMLNMLKSKVTHIVMEVSSHALDLYRVDGCKFDIAIFTNLTQDHLDYHLTMEKYWKAKQKLFNIYLKKNGTAIINCDDPKGKCLIKSLSKKVNVISTGNSKKNDIWPSFIRYSPKGTKGKIVTPNGKINFYSPLMGAFNLSNILNATGAGLAMGCSLIDISNGINSTLKVPGRLESVDNSIGIFVYIDYAHTPDALKNIIKTILSIHKGRIITIFGCGGNRDNTKRKSMGKIAAQLSDVTIVTSDNPRFEDPDNIIKQIVEGILQICTNYVTPQTLMKKSKNKSYSIIQDRQEAISVGIRSANENDTILIAGKGHETYQIIGTKTLEFDDKKEAKKILNTMEKTKFSSL